MRQLLSFIKKEFLELARGGKLMLLLILFILFGIMNPAMAKLTPWIMETMASQLENSGLVITEITVTAMTSWEQFYKNTPTALIIFVILMAGIFTAEYQRGTLVNMVTKGMKRWKILCAKCFVTELMWTLCLSVCFAITYAYNAYFWDNSIAENLGFSVFGYWLFGAWILSVIPLASAVFDNSAMVLLSAGAAYLIPTMLGFLPKIKAYLPTRLTESMNLLNGQTAPDDYGKALIVTGGLLVFHLIAGIILFDKRKL